jgi:hypothetical protein
MWCHRHAALTLQTEAIPPLPDRQPCAGLQKLNCALMVLNRSHEVLWLGGRHSVVCLLPTGVHLQYTQAHCMECASHAGELLPAIVSVHAPELTAWLWLPPVATVFRCLSMLRTVN